MEWMGRNLAHVLRHVQKLDRKSLIPIALVAACIGALLFAALNDKGNNLARSSTYLQPADPNKATPGTTVNAPNPGEQSTPAGSTTTVAGGDPSIMQTSTVPVGVQQNTTTNGGTVPASTLPAESTPTSPATPPTSVTPQASPAATTPPQAPLDLTPSIAIVPRVTPEDPTATLNVTVTPPSPRVYISRIEVSWDSGEPPTDVHTFSSAASCSADEALVRSLSPAHSYRAKGQHYATVVVTTAECNNPSVIRTVGPVLPIQTTVGEGDPSNTTTVPTSSPTAAP